MHFDFLHAVVSALLIWVTIWGLRRAGILDTGRKQWNWTLFAVVFVVIFVLNLIWSAG